MEAAQIDQPSVHLGAFLYLKQKALVNPEDERKYNEKTSLSVKRIGIVALFTGFWAHLIDYGSFLKKGSSRGTRLLTYAVIAGVPSLIEGMRGTNEIRIFAEELDAKYSPKFFDYQAELLEKKKKAAGQE